MDITLLSINTWKCDGDYTRRLPVLAAQLKESGADIILCQECFRKPGLRVPVANIHLTHFRAAQILRQGPRGTLGQAAIDHIYALPLAGSSQYPSFSEPGVVLNRSEFGLFPSDHFGFRVQLLCPGYSIS